MSLIRELNAQNIGQFLVPSKGIWNSIASNALPLDSLSDGLNIFLRKGKLRTRPGIKLLNSSVFNNEIIGGGMVVDSNGKTLLALTKDEIYTLTQSNNVWNLNTTKSLAVNNTDVIDIAYITINGNVVVLIANKNYQLRQWSTVNGLTDISFVQNSLIPYAKSICISARRVVCLTGPNTIIWSSTLTNNSFPQTTINNVSRTSDEGICVRPLATKGFILYKERSIYYFRSQAGSDEVAFTFDEPLIVEGPAGIHSVVVTSGYHFYMTRNGRIAMYDGMNDPRWIADGVWLYLQNDIDVEYSHKIFGIFDYRLNMLVFYYPRIGDNGKLKGMVLINFPFEGVAVVEKSVFLGVCSKPCSFGYEMRFNNTIDRSVLFSSTDGDKQSFILDENTSLDDGEEFDCSFTTPLLALPDQRYYDINAEMFFERGDNHGKVDVSPVVNNILETENGEVVTQAKKTITLSDTNLKYIPLGTNVRFIGIKAEWKSSDLVRYAGTIIYGSLRS